MIVNKDGNNMKEVYPKLFVGNQNDYENNKSLFNKWRVVHACKFPYHRKAVGYAGNAAPKGPKYYFAYDELNHLSLNMVDVDSPLFFDDSMIDEAINYCVDALNKGLPGLVHCNQGESRAPCLAMMVLRRIGFYKCGFVEAVHLFKSIYPDFNPKIGIYEYMQNRWVLLNNEN